MEDKIKKGESIGLTLNDINKINEFIQKEFNNFEKKNYEVDVADKNKPPKIPLNEIENMIKTFVNTLESMSKK